MAPIFLYSIVYIYILSIYNNVIQTMKPINCRLICWTSRGYEAFTAQCQSIRKAKEIGKQIVNDGMAFSYNIYRLKPEGNLTNEKGEN